MEFILFIIAYILIGGLFGRITYEIRRKWPKMLLTVGDNCSVNVAIYMFAWPALVFLLVFGFTIIGVVHLFCIGVKK